MLAYSYNGLGSEGKVVLKEALTGRDDAPELLQL